jgi:hypothetical protein
MIAHGQNLLMDRTLVLAIVDPVFLEKYEGKLLMSLLHRGSAGAAESCQTNI